MKTLRNEECRKALLSRIESLKGDEQPTWGRMTLDEMLSHLVQTGDLPFESTVPDRSNWISRTVIKPLMLYLLPMPMEVKVGPEMDQKRDGRAPLGFTVDKQKVAECINRLGSMSEGQEYLPHPFFGKLSAKQWGMIAHKHIDHHLRQFGA